MPNSDDHVTLAGSNSTDRSRGGIDPSRDGIDHSRNGIDRSRDGIDLSRYDLVLAAIPLAFVVGVFASGLLALPVEGGMALASTLGGVAVLDALFVNPPEVPGDPDE